MARFKGDLWDRSKDGNRREERSFARFAIIATAVFVLFMLVKRDSVITWLRAGFTLRQQKHEIERLVEQNTEMLQTIRMYAYDRDSLEKFARETYGFAEPGDDVYMLEER
ncbi:MAG TPA: septum formation initiator family protein [Candidatus Cryptobacteroides pullicola]|nr:septum formation initiator family protein [Candidatus Cryptobacteroides pullicola]